MGDRRTTPAPPTDEKRAAPTGRPFFICISNYDYPYYFCVSLCTHSTMKIAFAGGTVGRMP